MTQWVLDTCILYHASGCGRKGAAPNDAQQAHAALLALAFLSSSPADDMAEDRQGRIAAEYWRCWKKLEGDRKNFPSKDAVHNFWYTLWSRPHVQAEGAVPARLKDLLLANNMKEDGDIAFVEAAAGTGSKLLTTEDRSDYTEEVVNELAAALGITVLDYLQTVERIKGR